MLIRIITVPSNYDRTLHRRRLCSLGLLLLGVVGIVCYFALVRDSTVLPDFARGFYFGISSGITIGSLALLARTQYLITHPGARKKARIQEQDERERAITKQAFLYAGFFTFYLCAAAMLVLAAVDRTAALVVFAALMVYFLAGLAARLYLSKKL